MISRNDTYYNVLTGPTGLAVSLEDFKAYAKINGTDEDAILTTMIEAATIVVETYTNRWLLTRTAEGFYNSTETSNIEPCPFVEIRKSPLQSVESVEIWNGTEYVETTDYELQHSNTYARLIFTCSIYQSCDVYPIKVSFTAGYGEAADIPAPIKLAIMATANHMRDDRGDCGAVAGLPNAAKLQLGNYRIIATFA